jgi:hypothetical protein
MRRFVLLLIVLLAPSLHAGDVPELKVSSDFSGGSARVQSIDQATRNIQILPNEVKDRGWVCWWYFKLEGIQPGETITLEVGGGVWAQPHRAVFSLDNEKWTHTEAGKLVNGRMLYTQKIDAKEAWFAWGPVFTQKHAQALVDNAAKTCPSAKAFEFCKSADGRAVPALRITESKDEKPFGVWISARQHAWESGGSWVCKGLVDWLVSDDARAAALRKKAVFTIVPIMDIDDVELGAGGKGRVPNDHNRDWCDTPRWPEVRAAIAEIKRLSAAGTFDLFVDLHNPSANDKNPYFYTSAKTELSQRGFTNLQSFLSCAKEEMTGPLKFLGKTMNDGPTYDKDWKKISKNWVYGNSTPHVTAVTLETSWNVPESTQDNYQRVGKELGLAIERFLQPEIRKD